MKTLPELNEQLKSTEEWLKQNRYIGGMTEFYTRRRLRLIKLIEKAEQLDLFDPHTNP